jgi:hypothetical protein
MRQRREFLCWSLKDNDLLKNLTMPMFLVNGKESKTEEEGCGEKESARQEKGSEEKNCQESGDEEVTQPLKRSPRHARGERGCFSWKIIQTEPPRFFTIPP